MKKKQKYLKICGFFFLTWLSTSQVFSGCRNLVLTLNQAIVNFNLDPAPTLGLSVAGRTTANSCNYFLGFSKGQAGSYNRTLKNGDITQGYQLYKSFPYVDVLRDKPEAINNNEVIAQSQSSSGNFNNSHQFRAVLASFSNPGFFGTYVDEVVVSLYEGTVTGGGTILANQTLRFSYQNQRIIDMSLVDSGAPFNVADTTQNFNFGLLQTGLSQSCDLLIQYNAGYQVLLSSQNNGQMKHLSANSLVPYSIFVDGNLINLAGSATVPVEATRGVGVSPPGGLRLPTQAVIGTVAAQLAGNYSDQITITVSSTQ